MKICPAFFSYINAFHYQFFLRLVRLRTMFNTTLRGIAHPSKTSKLLESLDELVPDALLKVYSAVLSRVHPAQPIDPSLQVFVQQSFAKDFPFPRPKGAPCLAISIHCLASSFYIIERGSREYTSMSMVE
jgi:hypothetical protein